MIAAVWDLQLEVFGDLYALATQPKVEKLSPNSRLPR